MRRLLPVEIAPWLLPLVVAGLVVPSIAAFSLVGPQLGMAVGALTIAVVVGLAARAAYEEEIEVAPAPDARYRMLLVVGDPLEDPHATGQIAELAHEGSGRASGEPEVRVLAPVHLSRLDRWASDVTGARDEAQRALALSLATLAAAGLEATGKVGDADPLQAIEDELRSFSAAEVVLAAGRGLGQGQVVELRRRLDRPVRELARA